MSDARLNMKFYPDENKLPKFIVVMAHDEYGNLREHKYVHEDEVHSLLVSLRSGIDNIKTNFDIGGDTK